LSKIGMLAGAVALFNKTTGDLSKSSSSKIKIESEMTSEMNKLSSVKESIDRLTEALTKQESTVLADLLSEANERLKSIDFSTAKSRTALREIADS
jgi:hypothetical protein